MRRSFGRSLVSAALLAIAGMPAHAQYVGYGWGGWGGGGSTVQGSIATGMGNLAAGVGVYNTQTAEARAINANTAMQWNNYLYACNQRNAATELARRKRRQQATNETLDATYKRLHDNPDPRDVHTGDALNVVLNELANPKVYAQVVAKATTPIDSRLVKNIPFKYAPNMILISLEDISARGVPDVLATSPAFETDRKTIRALVAKGRKEAESSNQVSIETLRSFRSAVQAAKDRADSTFERGTRQRDECDNFLKALLGISRMLEQPDVEQFLKGLNRYPTTSLGHLITFMQSFNLKFGVARTPQQEATYDQLYPMLVTLRDQAQAQGSSPLADADAPMPDPKRATTFFSGMPYGALQSPPPPGAGVVPPPPSPGGAR